GQDDRVKGLVARISTGPGSMAAAQELRDAVKAFREKGKKAIAYSDSFGEFTGGSAAYYLAAAFDEVYLQPSGDVGLIGIAAETPFAKNAFEKLGVVPQMGKRHEYKNAVNTFTETGFDAWHREATEKYLGSLHAQLVKGIAEDRGLEETQVRSLIDSGPHAGQAALDAKLVDGLAYRDEVYAQVKEGWGADAELLYLHKYLARAGRPNLDGDKTIALIYGVGQVMRGESDFDPLSGESTLGSDSVAAAFRKAVDDDDVKAIVFRVDSPGGSYVASDTVRREVQRAREQGKPVVVTMGNLAASGGYFVSLDADRIVAQPGTLTGSIGVYAGKFVTRDFWEKLGVNWETVAVGQNAALFSTDSEFTPEQHRKLESELDRIYGDFTAKAAAGRKLPLEKLQAVAKGRVWTGADAKELGLVDELGGFPKALELAKELAKIGTDEKVRIELFPRPKSPVELLLAAIGGEEEGDNSESGPTQVRHGRALREQLRAVHGIAEQLGIGTRAGVLTAPIAEPLP
ncbi:MAG: signal peptide peptidase SppA, partial [Myxococcaceae bacterium]